MTIYEGSYPGDVSYDAAEQADQPDPRCPHLAERDRDEHNRARHSNQIASPHECDDWHDGECSRCVSTPAG